MNPTFKRWLAQAAGSSQVGALQRATAAIQAALRRHGAPVAHAPQPDGDVIDVEAHEVGARTAPPAGAPASAPSSAPAGRFITGQHAEGAVSRDYKLYIPPGWHGQALPLVVMLHGCTQGPDDFAAGTDMNALALERDFFVLYPAQAQSANPQRCWTWFKHNHQRRGRGEPALLAGMTRAVMHSHAIDPRRVYVAGLSAGGAMAAILGDAYPDLYAAVGVHSGLPTASASDAGSAFAAMKGAPAPEGPMAAATSPPTIVFHGDQDATVHPVNGDRVVAACSADATVQRERGRSAQGRDFTRSVYRDAEGRVRAEHWAVHGAGHAWSGGSARGSYTDPQGPLATQEMLRFFFSNVLPLER